MAVSKVILNGTTLIDVTQKTVTSSAMLSGVTALSADGNTATGTITYKAAQTYTPTTTNQTISSGQYLSGVQTIQGSANLTAANIKKGVTLFGLTGTFTSDANAVASNILSGKTAYVSGTKITGTMTYKAAQTYTPGTSNQTIASNQFLSGAQTILGDANLVASNIVSGVSIFGVTGTASGGGGSVTQDQDGYIVLPSTTTSGGNSSSGNKIAFFMTNSSVVNNSGPKDLLLVDYEDGDTISDLQASLVGKTFGGFSITSTSLNSNYLTIYASSNGTVIYSSFQAYSGDTVVTPLSSSTTISSLGTGAYFYGNYWQHSGGADN